MPVRAHKILVNVYCETFSEFPSITVVTLLQNSCQLLLRNIFGILINHCRETFSLDYELCKE